MKQDAQMGLISYTWILRAMFDFWMEPKKKPVTLQRDSKPLLYTCILIVEEAFWSYDEVCQIFSRKRTTHITEHE